MDEETENWPVPVELQDAFDAIKYTYRVNPLPVYRNDVFVEPLLVNKALKNALVEVHFNIRHFKIEEHDSFTAVPLQVIILKDGPPEASSPYKRKNMRDGPVRPKDFTATTEASTPVAKPSSSAMAPDKATVSARNASPSASNPDGNGNDGLGGPFVHVDSPGPLPAQPALAPIVERGGETATTTQSSQGSSTATQPAQGSDGSVGAQRPSSTAVLPGPGSDGSVAIQCLPGNSSGTDVQQPLPKRKAAAAAAATTRAASAADAQSKSKPANAA